MRNDAINGLTSTATAAGSTTLTVNSLPVQRFTGSTTQTIVLPVVTTLSVGWKIEIINDSTGVLTVNSSGGNLVTTVAAGDRTSLSCTAISVDTTAAPWAITNISKSTGTSSGITLVASVATTSGTSKDFTGIPAGVKRITVMLNGVSTNGTSNLQLQIGSGSILTTGYTSNVVRFGASTPNNFYLTATSAFLLTNSNFAAADLAFGNIFLTLVSGNLWNITGIIGTASSINSSSIFMGSVSLSGAIDRIRLTTANGTDTFDAGSWSISYE